MTLYRYHDVQYGSADDFDRVSPGRVEIRCLTFETDRETPKGWWLRNPYGKQKWVPKTGRKRFAYPTKDEAWESFQCRKRMQVWRCQEGLKRATVALALPRP